MYSIESLAAEYNPDHDINVDFAWVDYALLCLIEHQQNQIDDLTRQIKEIRQLLDPEKRDRP